MRQGTMMTAFDGAREIPYNILIGPLFNPAVIGRYRRHPRVRLFMSSDFQQAAANHAVTYDIATESLADMLAKLPADWVPDLLIWWDPIYQGIPPDIADCPIPSAVIAGDWNIHFFVTEHYTQAFDFVFGDRMLLGILQALGRDNCAYWPGWAFDADQHYLMPGLEKLYDISFIGNLNHRVQRQRGAALERIARLGDRYRVRIEGGVYGEAYTRMLNQSRIVFNYSICAGMNMRAFEAPACGALLFMEDSNIEVRELLSDGVSCVLYNEANLEAKLIYYLEHEAERAAIAAEGHRLIQAWSYEKQFEHLIDLLPQVIARFQGPRQRGFQAYSAEQQELIRDRQLYRANTPKAMQTAVARLTAYGDFEAPGGYAGIPPLLLNQLGKFLFDPLPDVLESGDPELAARARASLGTVRAMFTAAWSRQPEQVMLGYNLAWCCDLAEDFAAAETLFRQTLAALEAQAPLDVWYEPVLPGAYNHRFGVEWERGLAAAALSDDKELHDCRTLLLWRGYERLGHQLMLREKWSEAAESYREAQRWRADFGETDFYLGQALLRLGDEPSAMASYQQAVAKQPFMVPLWKELASLLLRNLRFAEAAAFLADRLVMLQANSGLLLDAPELEQLLKLARLGLALQPNTGDMDTALALLEGPFDYALAEHLRRWAQDMPLPPALIDPLAIGWLPLYPEPVCVLPAELGFGFVVGAQPQGASIGQVASAPPQLYTRVYAQASDLAQGRIGPDRLPYLFPDLAEVEAVELEDAQAFNFLLLTDALDSLRVADILQRFSAAFADAPEVCLFLWKPRSEPTPAEIAFLEAELGESQAQISLIQESFRPEQQGKLLELMQIVLGDPNESISYYLGWCLYLGVPIALTAGNSAFGPPPDAALAEASYVSALPDSLLQAWPPAAPLNLLGLYQAQAEHQAQTSPAYARLWQQMYRQMGARILDLCWELRLRLARGYLKQA